MLDTLQSSPKALPHSEEAERAVLGAILLDPRQLALVAGRLRAEDFYAERHQVLYRALLDLQAAEAPIDVRTLQARLEQQAVLETVGGVAYLASLDLDLPDIGRVESYVEIVKERSLRRRLIRACSDITRDCLDGGLDAQQALAHAEESILNLGEEAIPRGFAALGDVFRTTLEDLEDRSPSAMIGVPSGFIDLDEMTRGFNRSNLVIIAGRPGMGKCLSADAEIVQRDGGLCTIAELVRRKSGDVLTLGPEQRFRWTSPSAFVDDGVKPVFEVTTRLGRRIKVTLTHPFLTVAGWRPLGELRVGDAIGLPRRLDVFGREPLGEHRARLLGYLLGDGGLTGNAPRFTNTDPALLADFSDAVAKFGGVRTTRADSGGARSPTLSVVADEEEMRRARSRFAAAIDGALVASGRSARSVADLLGVSPASITGWRRGSCVPQPVTASALATVLEGVAVPDGARRGPNPLTRWLADLGLMGCGAREKFVPASVFRAPRSEVRVFLNRLFATDGWITTLATGQVQVGYCSVSERLARQVQHLLLRFGVIASLRRRRIRLRGKTTEAWQLDVTAHASIRTFLGLIGAYGKQRQAERALLALGRRREHSNRDLVPAEIWKVVDRERKGLSWADLASRLGRRRGFNLHVGKRGISRRRLGAFAAALDSEALARLADSDLYWDRITAIRYVGREPVYDLTVPESHNFVANDICVHNTSFCLNVGQHVAIREQKAVGVFSLEMSKQELALRILSSEADVPFGALRSGHLSQKQWGKVVATVRTVSGAPLYIDDSASPTLLEVSSKARRLKAEKGLSLIILDYLQLMQAGGRYENRNLEIAAITRGLKQLAKELDIPVIALSQLSRQPERRGGDHRPQLADLRECVAGDTPVLLADGRRVPVGRLVGQTPDVWSIRDGNLGTARSDRVWSVGRKPLFAVRLASGRAVRATREHRLLGPAGWAQVAELGIGDRLAITHGWAHGGGSRVWPGERAAAESDLFWDRVVEIAPAGTEEVFDLTVPGPACWLADGIVSHNSGAIEQDADLVVFIYRDEVYNREDPSNKGLAELIIAKHRNGETGMVQLVFLGETTSFRNLAKHDGGAAPF